MQQTRRQNNLLIFRKGDHTFGCDCRQVTQILPSQEPIELPNAPPFLMGLIQRVEQVIPVIDLGCLLGLLDRPAATANQFIQMSVENQTFCLLADKITVVSESRKTALKEGESEFPPLPIEPKYLKVYNYQDKQLFLPMFTKLIGDCLCGSLPLNTVSEVRPVSRRKPAAGAPIESVAKNRNLLAFDVGGIALGADVQKVQSIVSSGRSKSGETMGHQHTSTKQIISIPGIDPHKPSRTVVFEKPNGALAIEVDAISKTPIQPHNVIPVPTLLHSWIQPLLISGIAIAVEGGGLLLNLDVDALCAHRAT